jgi:hypothetical protein
MNDVKIIFKKFLLCWKQHARDTSCRKILKIQIWLAKKCVIIKCVFPSGIGFHYVGKQLHSNAYGSQYCFNLPFLGHSY